MELLALTTADLLIRKLSIEAVVFSDCTGAMKALGDHGRLRYLSKKHNLLLLQQSRWLTARMRYVRSHPERYSDNRKMWTRHMWGNHLTDGACEMDRTDNVDFSDAVYSTYAVDEALSALTHEEVFYWATADGTPTLNNFDQLYDEHLLTTYQRKRDDFRALRTPPEPSKWAGPMRRSCHFACECAETAHRNKGDKARMHRIIWDHFMHGGNAKIGIK